jgi:hypothetical protein
LYPEGYTVEQKTDPNWYALSPVGFHAERYPKNDGQQKSDYHQDLFNWFWVVVDHFWGPFFIFDQLCGGPVKS